MWKQLFDALLNSYSLMQRVEKQDKELKDVRQELRDLTSVVQRLLNEQEFAKTREADKQRLLLLEVENRLLRAQRQLPLPAKDAEDS